MKKQLRVAILDLNNNVPNRGISYIKRMVEGFGTMLTYTVFDVRFKSEIPDESFDIYISSGGPGSPFDFDGGWDKPYFSLLDKLWKHNESSSSPRVLGEFRTAPVSDKKFVFFICHSFQLACQFFKVGEIKRRVTRSFGTFPCSKTEAGEQDPYFEGLPEPFWIADFRDWQVLNADESYMTDCGFEIVAMEKARPHVSLPRAIMAVRFSDAFFGTQFHPEADDDGMLTHFHDPERKAQVIKEYGERRWLSMLEDLNNPMKINLTHKTILPHFLNDAIQHLTESLEPAF